uniref:Coiled-coil domain containing 59 n=1 Tax=Gasterosteus aculeatus aculeatus TaxID=481459 RepID=G3Q8A8_GASAC|nr:thyroid transcription factor 1-associated protein 26 homolog [Gasterosteus aculeatus aculeatus]
MAPTDQKMKNEKFTPKDSNWKKSKSNVQGFKHKRKWVPEQNVYEGSIKEGQGFALKRKEKVKHEYNKLLRKERKKNPESKALYKEEYPEHLKHLYMAEAQKLKNEAWTHRLNRTKLRIKEPHVDEESGESTNGDGDDDDDADAAPTEPNPEATDGSELTDAGTGNPESGDAAEKECLPMSNRMRKKVLKKTSYQKTKEEFEAIAKKQREKKEEHLKKSKQREEAIQNYKKKKMETFQILKKKTRKGQPNLNLQMEYLLQKITQGTGK